MTSKAVATGDDGIWTAGALRVFCSHVSADRQLVSNVKGELRSLGADAFVAHEDIEPTAEWVQTILDALRTCDALVAYLTPKFHSSLWTDQEVGIAIARKIPIIPLRLGVDPYGFLGLNQGLTLRKGATPRDFARAIIKVVAQKPGTAAKLANGIVAAFEESSSYADARQHARALQGIRQWRPEMIRRVEKALKVNDQIANAFGVPERVKSLLVRVKAQAE